MQPGQGWKTPRSFLPYLVPASAVASIGPSWLLIQGRKWEREEERREGRAAVREKSCFSTIHSPECTPILRKFCLPSSLLREWVDLRRSTALKLRIKRAEMGKKRTGTRRRDVCCAQCALHCSVVLYSVAILILGWNRFWSRLFMVLRLSQDFLFSQLLPSFNQK